MIKTCVVLDGKVINVGDWDYQIEQVEIKAAIVDEDSQEIIEPAEYKEVILNPFPEGAMIEERDFEYDEYRGWYEVGTQTTPTLQERLESAEAALLAMMEEKNHV